MPLAGLLGALETPSVTEGVGDLFGGEKTSDRATTGPISQRLTEGDIIIGGSKSEGNWMMLLVIGAVIFAAVKWG